MKQFTKVIVLASLALATAGARSAFAAAACGNLNNDASGVTSTDVTILGQCAAGSCPTISGAGICGTGNALDCGDIVKDGVVDALDVDALRIHVTGGDPLYDICNGPGPNISCPGGTVTLGSPNPQAITSSQTWPKTCKVILGGLVTIETPPGAPATVLTIEPGSVVRGALGTTTANPSALIFEQGSRIDANGDPANPIIFTSNGTPTTRLKGDWGGVVFNGRGTVNGPGCNFTSEGLPFSFGGCEADYNAGRATYIRVEFAGLTFTPNNELNLWTMNGLGTQTRMSYMEAVNGSDDCFEWFGGTSNHDHLVTAACADDALDYQLGFTGTVQHAVYIQNGIQTDTGADSRGIEADNSEFDNLATPISNPAFCNVTLVGAQNQAGRNDGSDSGVFLRRGTYGQFANFLVTAFADNCTELRDTATTNGACVDANADGIPEALTGNLVIRNSVMYGCGSCADSGGAPYEIAKDGDPGNTGDANAGVCNETLAATPGKNCDTESWYALLPGNANVNGVPPTTTFNNAAANIDQYPAIDNTGCTAAGVPFTCCSGAGTGSCRALWDPRPVFAGPVPAAYACPSLNAVMVPTTYLGGVNPAASCTTTGASPACDWMSKPWIEFNIN
ncbi:hypothetical protein KF840_26610 [bacterium]|nr:hypothetical protein [bacterium]